ncbi:TerD family protein [Sphingomonas carotinifaciens]|uniref:TerD family protein n=1 Tax=Sphingomonas carotinifaciens TaxID=1166323 RepID=UPI000DD9DDC4|nr:TerD family protein [Sphingomonas carotinifaciens]
MRELSQGGNAPVAGDAVRVALTLPAEADVSAYLLRADGRVRGDADMLFYNQPADPAGAVRLDVATRTFAVTLSRLDPAIERIVFCVTVDRGTVAALEGAAITAGDVEYRPRLAGASEAAMMLGELYRRAGQWKFRAVGQGFDGGLAPLARSFGIEVAEPVAAPPPPPPPPPPPVRLSKVTLDKPRQTVSLAKPTGEIVINLNWSRGRGGWGRSGAVDLDLGCLFELDDGWKGVIQALGGTFGDYEGEPWIALSADDRSGDTASGETMRVNGRHWDRIRRILVFALIYEGVPNWQATDGVVTVKMPGEQDIEVRMTEGRNDRRLCAVAMLENVGGRFQAMRLVDYHQGQRKLDEAYRWGLRWTAGSKD